MTTMRILITLLLGLSIFSCNQTQTTENKVVTQDTIVHSQSVKDKLIGNVTELLKKALTSDTVEFNNEFEFDTYKSFLFFKSGHILSKTEKNALVVNLQTDSTYTVKLYSLQTDQWKLSDSISELDAFPTQFDPIFDDYNFDGQTDLYIQVSASNGWSLSRGHLIIIDPMTKKFNLHKEARDFSNMTIDKKSKTIKTELWNGYDMKGRHQLTIFTNKWVNGQLTTTSKKNITIEPNK